jgi:flagellin-like hook-associated protein FlgL
VTLTATTSSPPEEGEFTIGGDAATTSANLQAALDTSLKSEANVTLKAASAVEAANNFFDYEAGGVPQRVDGPPFNSATGLRDATAGDTVFWYSGDLGPNAGKDFTAQIDDGRQLSYGARADQDSIRDTLKMSALLSAVEYSDAGDAEQRDSYRELTARVGQVLNFEGTQSVESIVTNLGLASATLENTQNRHDATMATANEILGDIQNADPYEVGVKLNTLETQLQASYQVTAMLSQLSLVNFI